MREPMFYAQTYGTHVIRRKIFRTDDPKFPSGYRYALHYGYTDGRGTILRYDNESQTKGRHERHPSEAIEVIEFPGMMELRKCFLEETGEEPGQITPSKSRSTRRTTTVMRYASAYVGPKQTRLVAPSNRMLASFSTSRASARSNDPCAARISNSSRRSRPSSHRYPSDCHGR